MDKIFTWEQWRMIFATPLSPVLAYLTPTAGLLENNFLQKIL